VSLQVEAIRQHHEKETARKAKAAADKKEHLDRSLEYARKYICEKFQLEKAPDFRLVNFSDRYWPDCFFEIDGIIFEYVLSGDSLRVEVICKKCQDTYMVPFVIPVSDGVSDLSRLGEALLYMSDDRHTCPVDQPPAPETPIPEPPKVVTYAIGSVEQRFLEALDELVFDAVDRHRE
jgi:hypothetical protein